ncbi:MAG: phosphoserine phosphatase SerB [Roseicyclus sp.]
MFTVTLITNPAMYLDQNLVSNLRDAMDGDEVRWLDPNHAAEFDVRKLPKNLPAVWTSLQAEGVDLVAQPAGNRRRKMLLADMDSTMIAQECIDELAAEAGVGAEVAEITARAMNGELDFEAALIARVSLLRGVPQSAIGVVLGRRITLMPGGTTLVATMKAHGAHTVLVSGGFADFSAAIAVRIGFDEHRANRLLAEEGVLTGDVARPILGRSAKVQALEEISARLGLTAQDVLAIGDGANDLGMIGAAGTGIAMHAKPVVQEAAAHRINHGDLTAVLFAQGYSKDEFLTG